MWFIEADYDTELGIVDTYWYLNEVEIYPEEIDDFGDGYYTVTFATDNDSILVVPGDILAYELYEEPRACFQTITRLEC